MKWKLLAALAGVVALAAYWFGRETPLEVPVLSPDTGPVETIVANTRAGTIKACQRAALALPRGGQVAELMVTEGDVVEEGQMLLRLSNDELAAQLNTAQALLRMRRSESTLACHQWELDDKDKIRIEQLYQQELISESAYDKAKTLSIVSSLRCEVAKTAVFAAEAAIALAEANLSHSELRAPFAGTVAEVNAEIGEYATPSPPGIPMPPAVDLIDLNCLYVSAPIDEIDAAGIELGQPARISLDAFGDRSFPAVVTRVAPYVQDRERAARTVEIEARFEPTPDATLLAGYSADIEVILSQAEDKPRVPTALLMSGDTAWLLLADNTLSRQPLELGMRNWRYAELLAPLPEGARLLATTDIEGLGEGRSATALPASKAQP